MSVVEIGSFNVTSGKVYVTDPCYNPGTWCQGLVDNVLIGKWNSSVFIDKTSWGQRVHSLDVYHEAYKDIEIPMEKQTFIVGVDAGVAGFFDAAYWKGRDDDEDEYDLLCDKTFEYPLGGCVDYGAISSSGFGDGSYDCFVGKNKEGKVVCMSIVYISEEDDEEESWEDDEEEYLDEEE